MHLLYIDDSGSPTNRNEEYFVLGGVSVIDSSVRWLTNELNSLATKYNETDPNAIEFHAAEIYRGASKPWDDLPKEDRRTAIQKVLLILRAAKAGVRVFAVAIHKPSFSGKDLVKFAYEELSDRFNTYLYNLSTPQTVERGMMIFDETIYAAGIQQLSIKIRKDGNRWGAQLRNIIEIPFFVNSQACRITQLADHVAYAVFRRYNAKDTYYFNSIETKFDCKDGMLLGLVHKNAQYKTCTCPACLSQRFRNQEKNNA